MGWRFVLRRCGDDLFSIPVSSPVEAQGLAEQLRASGDWLDVVPGIDSVVVRFDATRLDAAGAQRVIEASLKAGIEPLRGCDELIEIPVVYGGEFGPDLENLCNDIGMTPAEFIALHTGKEYTVDMVGFTPGFAFIGGLDKRLRIPRRAEPRLRVEAGSVGIADGRTGLYAMASPGGWTLVGRTPHRLFDASAETPFALRAGMRVRFRAIDTSEWGE
ncbi:MAG: 5-oxoprolinase subunit PxpB [Gammaproteobacteria bacterium]|jgi:KipI family sensor histidine kinase inhibitor|nr:5-oxoprolinase subunit PxpB [Gammaproteobacteria bacterium]